MNLYLFNANDSAATYGIGTYLQELTNALTDLDVKIHIVHLHSVRPEFEVLQSSPTCNVENWYVPEVSNRSTISGAIYLLEQYYQNVIYLLRLHIRDTTDLVFHFNYNQSYALAKGLKEVFDCRTVKCPGCGSQRAFYHLFHGEIATAFTYNPLMLLLIPYVLCGIFLEYIGNTSFIYIRKLLFNKWAAIILLFTFVIYTIIRNAR